MSVNIYPCNILLYLDSYLCYSKAKSLRSLCAARCICYIATQTRRHNSEYKCYCFKCRICRLLIYVLFSREHLKLVSIVTASNYLVCEKYICDFFRKNKQWKMLSK